MACCRSRYIHRSSAAALLALLMGLTTGTPVACRAQLHATGFSYGITTKGISQRQQLKTGGTNASDLQTTVSNLDLTNPNQYQRLNPAIPDFDFLQQQTLNNQRSLSTNNATVLTNNFTFSVFRSNQYQPPN